MYFLLNYLPFLCLLSILSLPMIHSEPTPAGREAHESLLRRKVANSYIVVLKKDVSRAVYRRHVLSPRTGHSYNIGSFHAYEATIKDDSEAAALANAPEVDFIEPNGVVTTAVNGFRPGPGVLLNSSTPSWNLHRISHRPQAPRQGPYSYLYSSAYLHSNCSTDAYIIDTGIYIGHSEFEGRASHGYNSIGGSNEDANGHGTHVAGIAVGKTFGVAKKGHAISVKALDSEGLGTYSSVMAGIDWSFKEAKRRNKLGSSVANLSLIGMHSKSLNAAVQAAFDSGLPVSVAAGNYGALAVNYSPASAHDAFTIGAHDIYDTRPPWSNYGIVLDHFAPGVEVRSAFINGPNSTAVLSGTSMASPHAAGIVNYLQCIEGLTIPRMIRERLEVLATKKEVIDGGNTSPRRILYNGAQEQE